MRELKSNLNNMEEYEFLEWATPVILDKYQKKIWKKSLEGWNPETYENDVREVDMCAHRGYGKSYLEGCHRMVKMVKYPAWESYTCYPKREQAMYSLGYSKSLIAGSPWLSWMMKQALNWGETKVMLPNKSYSFVISPSQRTATGYHVNQGYNGEAARWADDWDDIYNSALQPMTNRKKGQIWKTSSAFGERGYFHKSMKPLLKNRHTWAEDQPGFLGEIRNEDPKTNEKFIKQCWLIDVNITDIFSTAEKEAFKNNLGNMLYKQEYLCEFVGSAETFISQHLINKQSQHIQQYPLHEVINNPRLIDYLGVDPGMSKDKIGLCGIKKEKNNNNNIVLFEEIILDHYTEFTDLLVGLKKGNPNLKISMDSTGNQISLVHWLQSKGVLVNAIDFGSNKKYDLYQTLDKNLRHDNLNLPLNNELLQSQITYIPFKIRGSYVHIDTDNPPKHALDALVTIELDNPTNNFWVRQSKAL
jgi:hypothetical protein